MRNRLLASRPVSEWPPKERVNDKYWVRPQDWLNLPQPSTSLVGLVAIFNGKGNQVSLSAAGNYTVDWGDGSSPENFNSNVTATHTYTYSNINPATYCSRGYRQAIIKVVPQAGQSLTSLDLSKVRYTGFNLSASSAWLDVRIDAPNLTTLLLSYGGGSATHHYLENIEVERGLTNGVGSVFRDLVSIVRVRAPIGGNNVSGNSAFRNSSVRYVELTGTNAINDTNQMFMSCPQLREVNKFPISATGTQQMFYGCRSLATIPDWDTSTWNSFSEAFRGCYSLRTFPAFDMGGVGSSAGYSDMFRECYGLSEILATNLKYSFSIADCELGSTELNALYTNLPTVTAQTITVTGNYGTTGDDPTIATAKGWTVA